MDTFEEAFNRLTDEDKAEAYRRTIESLPEEAFEPVTGEPRFNYCVGHYWSKDAFSDGQSIGTYTFGRDIFYGTMADAEDFLAYVKRQSPDRDWKIFKLVPFIDPVGED